MAAAFVFRLQRLLELRERRVEECKKRLALAILGVNRAEAEVERLKGEQVQLNSTWKDEARRGFASYMALCFQQYVAALVLFRELAEKAVTTAKGNESECRTALAQALTKQKALERLRARLLARYTQETRKREQAELDDFAVIRAGQEER
ncbi:MAG: flagellar export protein FliJ [Planctomycetota bacterium]